MGTLFTQISTGFNTTIGLIDDPFSNHNKGFRMYCYVQPTDTLVGYDATLQGGAFNKDSPYTIRSGDIERVTA